MRESVLQKQIIAYCKAYGIYYVNVYGSGRSGKGTPDLLLCVNGLFVGFECKVGKNGLQPDQIIVGQRILKSGGRWFVVRTLEQAVDLIKTIGG